MKAALLANGPSRVLFDLQSKNRYNYIIGCNVPWTDVNSTVVLDIGIVQQWWKNKLPLCPIWFSEHAWRETRFTNRKYFENHFLGLVKPLPEYDTSGHVACSKLIELGYKEIDIYGCDSWFIEDTSSYTHQFHDTRPENMDKHIIGWRKRWNSIIENHKDVFINFIGYK